MAKQQLPDTPWHVGYSKMRESDHRRLNKWCVHYDASICRSPKSGCYLLRCGGSSHCKFYAEDKKASKKIEYDNRTQMEIEAENRRKYIASLKPKMQALVSSLDDRRYISVQSLKSCYICGSKLLELGKYRKQCKLCHMEYVDQVSWLTDSNAIEGIYVYVMGREKPAIVPRSQKPNSNAIQLEVKKFVGIKKIPISSIVLSDPSLPKQCKIDLAAEAIRRDGGVVTPIYVGIRGDKYVLKGGHIRFLAACKCGLYSIPATFERELSREK